MATKKKPAINSRYNKSQIIAEISDATELSRGQVKMVVEELSVLIERHIKKKSCREFVLPGIFKITTKEKPAQKAKKGVPNPFRPGETMDIAAKPKSTQVKVRALKKLKEFAAS
jgi:nucleoid DNA-binding protein